MPRPSHSSRFFKLPSFYFYTASTVHFLIYIKRTNTIKCTKFMKIHYHTILHHITHHVSMLIHHLQGYSFTLPSRDQTLHHERFIRKHMFTVQ
jgi:hypothetical protein